MLKWVFILNALVLLATNSVHSAEEGKHLFILSGQSNMARLKPGLSFKPALEKAFGSENIVIVKDAAGGKSIKRWYKDWLLEDGSRSELAGDLYDRLMKKVRESISGKNIKTVNFIWMQGERDAREKNGAVYESSLKGLVKQLSLDLQHKDINVVIGRINDAVMNNKSHPHWTLIREAQVRTAKSLPSSEWVDTDDLNADVDPVHATSEGYEILGKRFALSAIRLINNMSDSQ